MPHTALVTADELERFPDDDYRYELVEGRVVRVSPVGYQHGKVVARICALLDNHLRGRNLGAVLTEVGFKLAVRPDTVRAPDVAFIRQDRIPAHPRGFWDGAPDLAIEVLSPDDRRGEMLRKINEYLSRGAAVVAIVDPEAQTVRLCRHTQADIIVRGGDAIVDLGEVIPGFRCTLRDLFD